MNKIWVVLKSEFLRRVQNKWFIVSTILMPIIIVALITVPGLLMVFGSQSDVREIPVVDASGALLPYIVRESSENVRFVPAVVPEDSLRSAVKRKDLPGYLILPASLAKGEGEARFFGARGGGLSLTGQVQDAVDRAVEQLRLSDAKASPELLDILKQKVPVEVLTVTEEGFEQDTTVAATVVGYIMGFFIYIMMFMYGTMVMYGVMEEKQTRVIEVVVSSVRPFQLLMGKVLGIGAVGLVQMAVWSLLIIAGVSSAGTLISTFIDPAQMNLPPEASQEELLAAANISLPVIAPSVFVWFILFFIGGYLLYASLFAAIGSAVEQQQDAQSLMAPVTIPIILPILFMGFLIDRPDATASVIMSMIPFFSPILMVVRNAVTAVAWWEITLSYLLLIGTFVGAVWLSARIYRVGILMYGKKPSFKDMIRWVRFA